MALAALALPREARLWAWLGIDAAVSLLAVAVIIYTGEFEQAPTLEALRVARELPAMRGAVGALFRPVYWLFFADIPALAVLFAATSRRRRPQPRAFDRRLALAAALSAGWALAVVGLVLAGGPADDSIAGARRGGLVAYGFFAPAEGSGAAASAPSSGKGSPSKGKPEPAATPIYTTVKGDVDYRDAKQVQARFDGLQGYASSARISGAPKPAVAKGRSVVMVQAEALATWVLGLKVDGVEVTPNLNALMTSSWYAPKMVTQIGRGNTSDAEFTANTSLLGDKANPASYAWGNKKLPSLPRVAGKVGYQTATLHPNALSYWRRDKLYPALGFGEWYAGRDFPQRDIIGVGPSDRVLYEKALSVIGKQASSGKPFLTEIITLSAHFPYYDAAPHGKLAVPKNMEWTVLGEYLRAMHYQDEQLGWFVSQLKSKGLWDETVLVVYGDHFGVRPFGTSSAAADELTERERAWLTELLGRKPGAADNYLVPFLMHLPGQTSPKTIAKVRGQVDIFPTVTDVLGLDLSGTPHIGTTIFDDRPRRPLVRYHAPNATFIDDEYLFRPGTGYKDASVLRLSDSKRLGVEAVPKDLYLRVHALSSFNKQYLQSLPGR